jgi:superfamily II DNA helicase RecQ
MVALRPTDSEALLAISGIGQAKLARYGERFLAVINVHAGSGEPHGAQP